MVINFFDNHLQFRVLSIKIKPFIKIDKEIADIANYWIINSQWIEKKKIFAYLQDYTWIVEREKYINVEDIHSKTFKLKKRRNKQVVKSSDKDIRH